MGTLTKRSHSPLIVAKHQMLGAKSRQLIRMTRIWILTCADAWIQRPMALLQQHHSSQFVSSQFGPVAKPLATPHMEKRGTTFASSHFGPAAKSLATPK